MEELMRQCAARYALAIPEQQRPKNRCDCGHDLHEKSLRCTLMGVVHSNLKIVRDGEAWQEILRSNLIRSNVDLEIR
jgi:hypothetical protein